ncbi:HD domain-containing protein [Erysipelothrix sp. HDW6C]|uniref:3'-5' exoribonuclease YhaM family protein n=1 Tax=Erysipelothrix sp. HDW6C TaxID=2714930 RepID=UPI0014081FDC|nr:HD domain-containing protein [Erysipelothrix sp. HDW6C]QIK69964.1 HD domain-containing protein [Erysipelothrix sp. HDW6C]
MKIKEYTSGLKTSNAMLIARYTRGVTQNGAPYLSITFQDSSGEIEGKIWDVKAEQEARIQVGLIAEVKFDVNQYKQALQLRVHDLEIKDQKNYVLEEFVNAGQFDINFLRSEITAMIETIADPIIKDLVVANMDAVGEQFYQYPAATRNHHDFVGGLATHVYGMAKLAESVCELYPIYNRDLLLAGVILHDMGKIEEYTAPLLSEYSVAGRLLGHISIMQANFTMIATQLGYADKEQTLLLRHMILSHHGQLDYGSPVMPMVKEAEMLNFIDNMDARTNMFDKFYGDLGEGEFSSRMFALDNRNFYKAKGVK